MPTTYAHNLFGKKVYQKLEKPVQEMILRHPEIYIIGLHGPDILFYTRPFGTNRVNGLGQRLHMEEAAGFFERGKALCQKAGDEGEETLVYLLGFICHFMLDSTCHPYINAYEKRSGASHGEIETELDRALMEKTGKNPFTYKPAQIIHIRRRCVRTIASVLDGMSEKDIRHTLRMMKVYTDFPVCPTALKRNFLLGLVKGTVVYRMLQERIILKEPRKKCAESTARLERLFQKAIPETAALIGQYCRYVKDGGKIPARFYRNYN